ncbi:MAG: 30S ribosomal protein S15 [Candidatus Improbicoccus pseudotrichonymphae]|uniref:Small ribosomal subunit protein uS15 n=1 Tax=Candidatus Improbicoccus pseudotrichonymphae TaxID=3033792 RepID=A0AA48HUJ6_9FIRM|nr:MAG: 30S ribosomal protein S15 [Candidatus Improbicoccus pseudotrichonymphae]
MLTSTQKKECVCNFVRHEKDTGSSEVQIALFTKRINILSEHLKTHRKDFHSRKGLFSLIGKRRSLLDYLAKHKIEKYREVIEALEIRK